MTWKISGTIVESEEGTKRTEEKKGVLVEASSKDLTLSSCFPLPSSDRFFVFSAGIPRAI